MHDYFNGSCRSLNSHADAKRASAQLTFTWSYLSIYNH
ncbi:MAG: hypothetical protein OFPII_35000 [Osedax symbiont Rs1]|nr:MAG: hypothetical protein OFPII_35000 [Osedax symbiont Rs1]